MPRQSIPDLLAKLHNAEDCIRALEDKLQKLEADAQKKASLYSYVSSEKDKLMAQVEQIHAAFDGIPHAPARKYEFNTGYSTETRDRELLARFVGFLAYQGE